MRRTILATSILVCSVLFVIGLLSLASNANHYREAYLECAERCEDCAPVVSLFRTPQGVRHCYCDESKPDPDEKRLREAQRLLDSITTEPPPDFHI